MLTLKNIKKSYGNVHALKGINLTFRKNEFVSILGPSGCGKTTMLNIIGGLDRYTSGDLMISGISTQKYSDKDWDSYRNRSIGFVFQSYNLIPHLTILQNVELSMKLSGVNKQESVKRAEAVLNRVGLENHLTKKPNQLSGGQMQRVAIARALVNDPEIILADEPTGALDSKTSVVIMELLKEIAKDKLVIMVTHNSELAESYSSRIVELLDGEVIGDSNPADADKETHELSKQRRTAMPYFTALGLSGKNLWAKKGRTILTSFAGSIGIIGIALVLALSNGLSATMKSMESDSLSTAPITVSSQSYNFAAMTVSENEMSNTYPTTNELKVPDIKKDSMIIKNNITQEYIDYVNELNSDLYSALIYTHQINFNLMRNVDDTYKTISTNDTQFGELINNEPYNLEQYDVLTGSMPKTKNELVLIVNKSNEVSPMILESLGLSDIKDGTNFDQIVGMEYKLINNNEFYKKDELGLFREPANNQRESVYTNDKNETLKIVGVLRPKETASFSIYEPGIYYTSALTESYINSSKDSDIVKAQREAGKSYSVLSGVPYFDSPMSSIDEQYSMDLERLGDNVAPKNIKIIPKDFDAKKEIRSYLNAYNDGKDEKTKISYTDISQEITGMMETTVNTVSYVLIGFSSISLIVSSLMIGIITYVSVIERTKEIGVLRSLGARKKDISRVFNAETFLIGLVSGVLGIVITYLLTFPINTIIYHFTKTEGIASVNPIHAVILIVISITLTLIAGFIPSRMASRKDPVVALRSE